MQHNVNTKEIEVEVELLLMTLKRFDGHDFTGYSIATLMRRIQKILADESLPSISSLVPLAVHDKEFRQHVIDELTINVSSLFRDEDVFIELRNRVLPYLASFPQISIWIAGCAEGEEAYSIAILLAEAGLLKRSQIYATDISKKVLACAKIGKLRTAIDNWSIDRYAAITDGDKLQNYFNFNEGNYILKPELLSRISFECHDIIQQPSFISAQLVMCRNMMIYFDKDYKQLAFDCLDDSLEKDGFMVIGKSESVEYWNDRHKLLTINRNLGVYQKK